MSRQFFDACIFLWIIFPVLNRRGPLRSESFEDIHRRAIAALRSADLRTLHALADGGQHLASDGYAFLASGFRTCGPGHTVENFIGHGNSELVLHEFGVPGTTGIRKCSIRLRKASSRLRSNTGWVTTYSAPASTLYSKRLISSSRLGSPGFAPTPMTKPVPTPIGLPPRSNPRFRLWTTFTSPIESTSNTAVASG